MRDLGTEIMHRYPDVNACPNEPLLESVILFGAAALLEVHDATGISLDDWTGPHEIVIQGLLIAGYDRSAFLENGV